MAQTQYLVVFEGETATRTLTEDEFRTLLAERLPRSEFEINSITPGAPFRADVPRSEGREIFTVSRRAAATIATVEYRVLFRGPLGDEYVWSERFGPILHPP